MPRHSITWAARARKRKQHTGAENRHQACRSTARRNAIAKHRRPAACTAWHRPALMLCALQTDGHRCSTYALGVFSRHACAKQGGAQPRTGRSSNQRACTCVPRRKPARLTQRPCVRTAAARKTGQVTPVRGWTVLPQRRSKPPPKNEPQTNRIGARQRIRLRNRQHRLCTTALGPLDTMAV